MSLARNTVINLVGSAVPIAVTLVTIPLYLSTIGLERFGILSIGWILLGYFGLFDLGLGRATAQKIAALKSASPDERQEFFWTAICLNAGLGILAGVVLLPAGYFAFGVMKSLSPDLAREANAAVPWLAATMPVATITGVLIGALQGRERFLQINLISIIGTSLTRIAPLLVAIYHNPTLPWLIAAAVISRLVPFTLLYRNCVKFVPLRGPQRPVKSRVGELLRFGGWITVTNLLNPLLVTIDRFLIGAIVNAAAVAYYVVPYNLVSRITFLPRSLANAAFPRFASGENGRAADKLLIDSVDVLVAVLTPLALAFLLTLEPFLILWLGEETGRASAPAAHILVLGFWIHSLSRMPISALQGGGRPERVAMVHLAEAIPYLALLTFAIRQWGVTGAAAVWALRAAIEAIFLFWFAGAARFAYPKMLKWILPLLLGLVVVFYLPLESPLRWAASGALLLVTTVWVLLAMPSRLIEFFREIADIILRILNFRTRST